MTDGHDDKGNGTHGDQKRRLNGQGNRENNNTDVNGQCQEGALENYGTVNDRRRI